MDSQLIQRTRYVLRTRARRTQTCPATLFSSACQQMVDWIQNHPILSAIVNHFEVTQSDAKDKISEIIRSFDDGRDPNIYEFFKTQTTLDHANLCYHMLKAISTADKYDENKRFSIYCHLVYFCTGVETGELDKLVEQLRNVAVDGLFEYLDEQIDTRNILCGILSKYKQRCEWFQRPRLRLMADSDNGDTKGEKALAKDLQEYIFDQGVEFIIEPTSVSGKVDLILKDPEGKYMIIDAKYINSEDGRAKIRDKIAKGFHQVFRYCTDFNEPDGYLVSFVNTNKRISLGLNEIDGFTYLPIGGKTIYHQFILISDEPSASKQEVAEEITIDKNELVISFEPNK